MARSPSEALIARVLDLWLARGNPNLARSLWVRRPYGTSTIPYPLQARNEGLIDCSQNLELMPQALEELELQRTRLDWDSIAYRGLVNLQLSFKVSDYGLIPPISLQELADVLLASPLLSTLKLSTLRIHHPKGSNHPAPVWLSCLRDLSIFYLRQKDLELLLSVIIIPETSTGLRIGLTPQDPLENSLERFLLLSRATELYMYNWGKSLESNSVQLSFLKSMSHLRSLVLDNYTSEGSLIVHAHTDDTSPPALSCIPRVILLECHVALEGSKVLSEELQIKELRIEKCQSYAGGGELQVMSASLGEAYPETKCIVADTDSTENWGYCSIDV
ncbi:hypothetical protein FRC07_008208 [Ceratobasidium sp. 392]|nr:hypothetical protein FRC07_008208 [Ceratobasidium sp. 392]